MISLDDTLYDAQRAIASVARREIGAGDAQRVLDTLDHAVEQVAETLGDKVSGDGTPSVAARHRSEVRWAYDALTRGDSKLASARLKLVIHDWNHEEKTR
ncbi:MAG: hypothetical protein GVY24_08065 [Planctomycetes bacterium]|nr:hypothetical protein [Planctomycetota bacterium]